MSNLIVSEAGFSRVIRAGDSTRFKVKLKTDREVILRTYITEALQGTVNFEPHFKTDIKRKPCISIPHYNSQLILRSISRFLTRRFRITLPNRDLIIAEVIQTLADRTPMHIIRRDIKSFYESVPSKELRSQLEFSSAIPALARKYISKYFDTFCSASDYGLPRGIGLSAVLVEYSMQDFDQRVREIDGVYRYYRFSDDMLVFCYKNPEIVTNKLEELLKKTSRKFILNEEKSGVLPLVNTNKKTLSNKSFEFLGYNFCFEDFAAGSKPRRVNVGISASKISKLKTKTFLSFKNFQINSDYTLLRDRLRYLSGNYKVPRGGMANVRDSIFIKSGIYFSYRLCGSYVGVKKEPSLCTELKALDNFYQQLLSGKKSAFSETLSKRLTFSQIQELRRISFRRGHELQLFVRLGIDHLDVLKRIWRNV